MNTSIDSDERYIEVEPGVKLHITDKGRGKALVLIPGLPLSDLIFKYTYDMLAENGYRAIGITLRGFGQFESPDNYDVELHARDINKILRILRLEEVVLCGYSFGGVIAAYYLSRYRPSRVSKLALISSNVPLYIRHGDYPYGLSVNELNRLIKSFEKDQGSIEDVFGPILQPSKEAGKSQADHWLNNILPETAEKGFKQRPGLLREIELRPLLSSIDIPTLIMHSKDDSVIPFTIAEQAHEWISNSQLVVFETGGQWYFLLAYERFNAELLQFAKQ